MAMKLRPRPTEAPVGRRGIVQVLASLDDDEFRAVLDEARGASLIPLAELVVEGVAPSIQHLCDRCGDAVVVDDVGRKCVTRETARTLIRSRVGSFS